MHPHLTPRKHLIQLHSELNMLIKGHKENEEIFYILVHSEDQILRVASEAKTTEPAPSSSSLSDL